MRLGQTGPPHSNMTPEATYGPSVTLLFDATRARAALHESHVSRPGCPSRFRIARTPTRRGWKKRNGGERRDPGPVDKATVLDQGRQHEKLLKLMGRQQGVRAFGPRRPATRRTPAEQGLDHPDPARAAISAGDGPAASGADPLGGHRRWTQRCP